MRLSITLQQEKSAKIKPAQVTHDRNSSHLTIAASKLVLHQIKGALLGYVILKIFPVLRSYRIKAMH